MDIEPGAWVWFQSPKKTILQSGKVLSTTAKDITIQLDDNAETVPRDAVKPMHPSSHQGIDDMTNLIDLHEGSILRNLKLRFLQDSIYTYTGSILVALNPFKNLSLYDLVYVLKYRGVRLGELPPHIFAIADEAHNSMMVKKINQCVVISGESGAGKTESTKLIVSYLAHLSGKHSQVEEQLIDSSPILEAFGNAKTTRNNNSSRFGKFMEIQFSDFGSIEGAKINQYLLEKSRIVNQAPEERNFHIFYNLLAGASPEEREKFKLTKPQDYAYTNKSGCVTAKGIEDEIDYDRVKNAMENLGLKAQEVNDIMRVVAIVLHVGNLTFKKNDDDSAAVDQKKGLEITASLLEITPENLAFGLTHQVSVTRNEKIIKPLSVSAACDSREALAKALYGWMFTYIVERINSTICKAQVHRFIGVLDIFGFEDFKINSFEQFCINFANERLQQFFNQHIFKLEQEIYTNEGINWSQIEFIDNQPCLDLIAKKPIGILHILDEECNFPKASDATFLEKLHKNHATKDQKYYEKPKLAKTSFMVVHYAGKVSYEVDSFLEKNRDRLREDLQTLLDGAGFKFISKMIAEVEKDKPDPKLSKNPKPITAASRFHDSLASLVSVLSSCNPFFVRCVKPNPQQVSGKFDENLIEDQLRYSGLLETVRIRKLGFPVRMTFEAFGLRYGLIDGLRKKSIGETGKEDPKKLLDRIMKAVEGIQASHWQIGKTKVFMKEPVELLLEKTRQSILGKFVVKMQRRVRIFLGRRRRQQMLKQIKTCQKIVKGFLARRALKKKKKALLIVQSFSRMVVAKRRFQKFKKSVSEVQRALRILIAKEMIRERDELYFKEARAKAAATKLAETRARLEKEKQEKERLEKEKLERERVEREKAEAERVAAVAQEAVNREKNRLEAEVTEAINRTLDQVAKDFMARAESVSPVGATPPPAPAKAPEPEEPSIFEDIMKDLVNLEKEVFESEQQAAELAAAISEDQASEVVEQKVEKGPSRSNSRDSLLSDGGNSDHSFVKYAAVHFAKGVGASFSKTPLKQPLLELSDATRHEALVISQMIMAYMGDFHLRQTIDSVHAIRLIAEKGIHQPILRDEIYCQILKQCTDNPNPESVERGFLLLFMCLSCFSGSVDFNNWIKAYIEKYAPEELKAHCVTSLFNSFQRGSRKMPICTLEYVTKMSRSHAIPYQIGTIMPDKSCSISLDSSSRVSDVVRIVTAELKSVPVAGLSLGMTYEGSTRVLEEDEFLFDAISELESEKFPDGNFGEPVKPKITLLQAFLDPETSVDDPMAVDLLYKQILDSFLQEDFVCIIDDAALMVAIQLKLAGTDQIAKNLPQMLSHHTLAQFEVSIWETRVKEYLKSLNQQTPLNMKKRAIKLSPFWPGVFGKYFEAQCVGKSRERVFGKGKTENKDIVICVDCVGISFVHPKTRAPILPVAYFEIEKFDAARDNFDLQLEGVVYSFKSPRGLEIKDLVTSISTKLLKVTKLMMAHTDNNVEGKDALKFSKEDLIMVMDKNIETGWWKGRARNKIGWFSADLVSPVVLKPKHLHEEEKKKRAELAAAALAMMKAKEEEDHKNQAHPEEAPKEESIGQQYSMLNYAKLFFLESSGSSSPSPQKSSFRQKFTLGRSKKEEPSNINWGWTDLVKKIKHSKVPITSPLTKVYDPQENDLCIELFKVIMRYMGDLPTKQTQSELAIYLVAKCQVAPLIRDEVYCQIIKQVTSHPNRKSASCRQGWELLSLCAGFFPPSEVFEPYLRKYILTYSTDSNTEFYEFAKKCELKLRSIKKNGARQFAPREDEILGAQGRPLFIKVTFPDSVLKAVEVVSSTTGKEFVDSICSRMGLEFPEEYAVFVLTQGREYMLMGNFFVMDVIAELESTPEQTGEYKFLFRKFIWPQGREINLKNEQLVNIIFSQNVERINNGEFRLSLEDTVEYAATLIKCNEKGEQERSQKHKEEYYRQFILSTHIKTFPINEWVTQIDDAMERYSQFTAHDTKGLFVKKMMGWPSFGDTSFLLEKPKYEKLSLPDEVILTINSEGIRLVHAQKKTPIVSHPYQEISSWRFGPENISMKIGGMVQRAQKNMRAQTEQGEEICLIISYYVAALTKVRAEQRHGTYRR